MRRLFIIASLVLCSGWMKAGWTSEIVLYQQSSTSKPQQPEEKPGTQGTQDSQQPEESAPTGTTPGGTVPPYRPGGTRGQQPAGQPSRPAGESEGDSSPPQVAKPVARPQQSGQAGRPKPRADRNRKPGAGKIELVFDGTPIEDVISTIMEELQYSYVIDPQVTGTVSLFTRNAVPREQLFGFLEQLLQMNGFGIIRQSEDFFAIVLLQNSTKIPQNVLMQPGIMDEKGDSDSKDEKKKSDEKKGKKKDGEEGAAATVPAGPQPQNLPTGNVAAQAAGTAAPPQPVSQQAQQSASGVETLERSAAAEQLDNERGVITYVVPLNFIPSSEFLKMAQVYMSDGATVVDFAPANIIMITDFRRNVQQVLDLVNLLDTRFFDINSIDLIPIRYHNAIDVAEDLGKIFAPDNATAGVRLVAIERLNSILVVTHGGTVLSEVKAWIDRLDSPASGSTVKTFIYQVENNTASHIATVLEQLYQDGFGLPSTTSRDQNQAGSGASQSGQQQSRSTQRQPAGFVQDRLESGSNQRQRGGAFEPQRMGSLGPSLSGRPDASAGIRAVVTGNVKIIVNEFNNSLIIQASENDYQYLMQTIRQLDTLPRQVIIEAEIYSVILDDSLNFGVMAFLEQRNFADDAGPATTGSIVDGVLNAVTRATVGDTRQFRLQINALKANTDVQVLDAPRVLTMDGVQATINIGAEVPVSTSSFSDPLQSGNTGFVNQISFRPTGTTLLIVPRISASGIVTLELSLEVSQSSSAGTDETNLTPTINRSYVETTMLCRDGQTIALGGIISEQEDESRNRVPVLGDIPVMGALFGNTRRTKRRFELIFFITPRVVQSLPTAAELTLEFKRALRNSYDFIDEKRAEEDEMIESRRKQELERKNNN